MCPCEVQLYRPFLLDLHQIMPLAAAVFVHDADSPPRLFLVPDNEFLSHREIFEQVSIAAQPYEGEWPERWVTRIVQGHESRLRADILALPPGYSYLKTLDGTYYQLVYRYRDSSSPVNSCSPSGIS